MHAESNPSRRSFTLQVCAVEMAFIGRCPDLRLFVEAETQDRHWNLARETLAVRVVRIDNRRFDSIGVAGGEENAFSLEIRLHVSVEIEVVMREIHEYTNGEPGFIDALQFERVGGYLQGSVRALFSDRLAEEFHQIGGFRCCVAAVESLLADPHLNGSCQAGTKTRVAVN